MKFRDTVVRAAGTISVLASHVASLEHSPSNDFCRRFYHQSATIKDRVYIDGGFIGLPDNPSNYTNNRLVFHDLSDDSLKIPPLITKLTSKPNNVPDLVGGQLWADQANEKLYMFGGEYSSGPPLSPALWSYDPWSDTWAQIETNGREGKIQRPSFGAGLSVEHLGMGYYLGGWLGPMNVVGWQGDRFATSDLISYDMIGNTFRKDSGPGNSRVEGTLQYVPTGDAGLLVSFGGLYVNAEKEPVGASMRDIDVYDVSAKVWHRIQASGDIPKSRRLFCGGLSSAADGSSHNIYIYGGASTSKNDSGLDDIYILTMPSFIWVKYWVHDPPRVHNGFSCNVINKGQMMVLGGTFPLEPSGCDAPAAWGAHIMDLGRANPDSAEWYGYRKDLTTYTVPPDLIKVIGGGPTGGATLVMPQGGFNSSDLKTLFSRTLVINVRQPTRTPSSNDKDNGPPLAIIIGPSVGLGVPVIAAMLGFYLMRAKKQARQAKFNKQKREINLNTERIQAYQLPTTQSPTNSPGHSYPGYQYPIHPYALAQNQTHQAAPQPYLYQPPHLSEYQLASGVPMQPQELPAGRLSPTLERTGGSVDENDESKDKLREFYGNNPFEDTSMLEKPREVKTGEEPDWRGEEKPLPSPNRRRMSNSKNKPLPEYPKWDPKRRDPDSGPMPGKTALNHMF